MIRAGGQRPPHPILLICWIYLVTGTGTSGAPENQGEHCTTSDGRPGLCVVVQYCREAVASFPRQLPTVCYQKGAHHFACCPIPDVDPLSEVHIPNQPNVGSSANTRPGTVNTYQSTGKTPWAATPTDTQTSYSTIVSSRTDVYIRDDTRTRTRHSGYKPLNDDSTYRKPATIRPTRPTYSSTVPHLQPSRSEERYGYTTEEPRYEPVENTDRYHERSTSTKGYTDEQSTRRDTGNYHPPSKPRVSTRTTHSTSYPHYDPPSDTTRRHTRKSIPTVTITTTIERGYSTAVPEYEKDRREDYPVRNPNLEGSRSYHVNRDIYTASSRSYGSNNYDGISREDTNRRPSSSRVPQIEITQTEIRVYTSTKYPYIPVTTDRKHVTPSGHRFPSQTHRETINENLTPQRQAPTHSTYTPSKNSTKRNPSNAPILSEAGCGEPILELFVAGGEESRPGDWPWMVAIYRLSLPGRSNKFICGGVLINRRHIISAAHCFVYGNKTLPSSRFIVRLGAHDRETMGEDHVISRLVVHEGYVSRFHDHDVAILYLENAVPYTRLIQPVCLPGPELANEDFVGKKATVIGWGDTSFAVGYSQVLNEVAVPVVSSRDCFAAYAILRSSSFPRGNMEQYICAGFPDGGKDACQGDSGGPLLVKGKEGRWTAIGIVSFGFRCAEPGFPGVYSRLSYYLSWIERKIYNI